MTDTNKRLVTCLHAICHAPGNPVAWLELEAAGLDKQAIIDASNSPEWEGPKPILASYPCAGMREEWEKSNV